MPDTNPAQPELTNLLNVQTTEQPTTTVIPSVVEGSPGIPPQGRNDTNTTPQILKPVQDDKGSTPPIVQPIQDDNEQRETSNAKRLPRWLKITLIILGSFLALLLLSSLVLAILAYFYVLPPARTLKQTTDQLQLHVTAFKTAAREQHLTNANIELDNIKTDLATINTTLNQVAWAKRIPQAKPYLEDAAHVTTGALALVDAGKIGTEALIPYADLLGFTVDQSTQTKSQTENTSPSGRGGNFENQTPTEEELQSALDNTHLPGSPLGSNDTPGKPETAKDRIQFVVETLDALVPQLDTISERLSLANQSISQIDPNRYPETLSFPFVGEIRPGFNPRQQITQLVDLTKQATVLVTDARPLLEVAPYMLGNDATRKYLILFQNDAELRPTGGFLTAYALLNVDKGQLQPGISQDIYDLDAKYTPGPAPEPILKYLPKVTKWNLRDMNLSPDFKVSMDTFYEGYKETGSPQIDGIIGIDTQFLLALLKVTGPIGVGGVGNFSAEIVPECNCPQVVYALESTISVETPFIRQNRKAIIGPLMHSVLANAMGTPKEKMSQLVQAGLDSIKQKHILMYFNDPKAQAAIEAFNMAGRVRPTQGDYLMIVDTNFAGAKSNLYIDQEIDLKVDTNNSVHDLTITWKNPQKHDGWLNGDFRNWFRVYVPAGARLLEANGSEVEVKASEDLDKTVLEGFLVTRPMGLSKLTLKYEVEFDSTKPATDPYKLLIQKQGGTKNFFYTVNINGQAKEFELNEDKELSW